MYFQRIFIAFILWSVSKALVDPLVFPLSSNPKSIITSNSNPFTKSVLKTNKGTGKLSGSEFPPIIIKGNKFYYSNNNTRFFIKGIAYQQTFDSSLLETQKKEALKEKLQVKNINSTSIYVDLEVPLEVPDISSEEIRYSDPLADEKSCLRDIPLLNELGVNLIRVYSINPTVNHDVCMNALADAGIYVIADLSEPFNSINREHPSWNIEIYDRYKSVVDALAKYNNLFGFFAGNEVSNDKTNTDASPYVKAAVRDTKAYIKKRKYRNIPVGYSSNDDGDTRVKMANYFKCGTPEESIDFYGINMYEWCGFSSFFTSGYSERTIEFQNYNVPLFFSEFGCNLVRPRPFQEVEALFSPLMTSVWSGGIVYMFHEEQNKYGVVKVEKGKNSVKKLDDFRYLRDAFTNAKPKVSTKDSDVKRDYTCPAQSETWKGSSKLPSTPFNFKCECLETSLECIVSPKKKKHDFAKLYQYLCNEVDCSDITGNGTTGEYGYYSDCDDKQRLSYVLDKYYLKNHRDPKSCDFKGEAFLNKQPQSRQDLGNIAKNGISCANVLKSFSRENDDKGKKKGGPSGSGNEENANVKHHSGSDKIDPINSLILAFIFVICIKFLT